MTRHFTELKIETYRGIKDLCIKDLGDINILVGDNNSGKTSVLEAIQILCDPSEYNIIQVARQREKYRLSMKMGLTILDLFMYMFSISSSMKDTNQYRIALSSVYGGNKLDVRIQGEVIEQLVDINEIRGFTIAERYKKYNDLFEGQEEVKTFIGKINLSSPAFLFPDEKDYNLRINEYISPIRRSKSNPIIDVRNIQMIDYVVDNAFNNIIKNKEIKEKAISLLKDFDENISDLRYINENDRFVPVVESNLPEYLPLSMYGDGMKKTLTILNALVSSENGIVLVDEFETALHTSAMENVFRFVISACKKLNVQLFLTTHSIEAVDKILKCSNEEIDNIRIITLKKDDVSEKTLARVLKGSEVLEDRKNFDFEVRQ